MCAHEERPSPPRWGSSIGLLAFHQSGLARVLFDRDSSIRVSTPHCLLSDAIGSRPGYILMLSDAIGSRPGYILMRLRHGQIPELHHLQGGGERADSGACNHTTYGCRHATAQLFED
eukprot:4223301-Pyramimonas_sp.AAC.1